MRIGIDIDGVLTDMERFIIDYGTKFCVENNLPLDLKLGFYDESKSFDWTEEQTEKFWNAYIMYYAKEYAPREFTAEVIKKLKEEGHEIYIVTARNDYGVPVEHHGEMKAIVEEWLKDNDICYDKVIFTEGNKLPYCVGNYIELMIEDCPEQIINISSKIPTFCFNNEYNKEVEGENITRVYTWYDVYNKIKNIK